MSSTPPNAEGPQGVALLELAGVRAVQVSPCCELPVLALEGRSGADGHGEPARLLTCAHMAAVRGRTG